MLLLKLLLLWIWWGIKMLSTMFTVAQLWQCSEYLLSQCWRSNLSSFYVYPLTSCGSSSEIMTDINKTQTSSYLQIMSLLRRPSHFITNQKNQQVEKEKMYKISNIGFVCFQICHARIWRWLFPDDASTSAVTTRKRGNAPAKHFLSSLGSPRDGRGKPIPGQTRQRDNR